jgi:hypothetical protein
MTRYTLTETVTQDTHVIMGRDADGAEAVALACPWHADPLLSCICDLTYGSFWCVTCDREGTCLDHWLWESPTEVRA